ncbi:MAG: hypothetical protein ACK6D2_17015 [Planctomycetota bacterium]
MGGLKDSLRDAIRQIAFRTSVDRLRKQGVKQVSVLGLDRIIALIDAAVHSSLKSRLVGADREVVADATKAEFLRLLRSNGDLQRETSEVEKVRERTQDELDALRRELAQQQSALRLRLERDDLGAAARWQGEDAAIADKVAAVVRELAGAGEGLVAASALESRVVELVQDVVADERRAGEVVRKQLADREVGMLQQRIDKLSQALALTEHKLQQVSAQRSLDAGISSIYREVQGLAVDDTRVDAKKGMMAAILAENLRLQKRGTA